MSKTPPPGDNGEAKAPINWEAELANHRSWLRTVIAARLGDRHAVDDVFQEVALAAVEQRSAITDRSLANAGVTALEITGDAPRVRRINATAHLEPDWAGPRDGDLV